MNRPRRIALRPESGFTLIELLVSVLIATAVIGAGLTVFTAAIRGEPRISDRSAKIEGGRTTLERVTRELRQTESVIAGSNSQLLAIETYVDGACPGAAPVGDASALCAVVYDCRTGGRCLRTVGTGPTAQTATIVSGLQTATFSYTPSPALARYIAIEFVFPGADGTEESITLTDGAGLRNAVLGGESA